MWLVILIHSPVLQELQLASNIYMSSSMYESGRPETLYPNGIFQGKKKSMVLFSCAQDITCRNDLQVKRIQYYQTCPYLKKISTAHFWALIWRLPVHRNLETWHTHLSMSTCVRWIEAGKYWTDYLFVSHTPVYSYVWYIYISIYIRTHTVRTFFRQDSRDVPCFYWNRDNDPNSNAKAKRVKLIAVKTSYE
jgi:hypothetical protein